MSWRLALLRLAGIRAKEVSKTYTRMTIPRKRANLLDVAVQKVRATAWREGVTVDVERFDGITSIVRSDGRVVEILVVD